jgi:hypothetical protein
MPRVCWEEQLCVSCEFATINSRCTDFCGAQRGELRGDCALIVSPQFLVAARKGLPVPFACSETNELGEELVGSYLYQVHLQHWLESNNYDRSGQTATYI